MWSKLPLKNLILVISSSLAVLLLVVVGLVLVTASPIPKEIRQKVPFTLIYPKSNKLIVLDKSSIKYDEKLRQMSFMVRYAGCTITFAEQTTPDQFVDIPEYLPKLLEKMNSYSSFENTVGKVSLTRPTEVKSQVAVMNTKGTLLFARTDGDLSVDQWRSLFNSLIVESPK